MGQGEKFRAEFIFFRRRPNRRECWLIRTAVARVWRADETECFFQDYGRTAIDPLALAYYRYAWAVQDIAAYGEQVFFSPDLGEVTRRAAVQGFMDLFAPGNIVVLALASTNNPG